MLGVLLIGGCFRSLQFTGINALSYADVSNARCRARPACPAWRSSCRSASASPSAPSRWKRANLYNGGKALGAGDFWPAFLLVGLISASSVFVMARLAPDAGAEVSGHGQPSARKATAEAIADQKPPG